MKHEIIFLPEQKKITVQENETVLAAACQAGILIDGSCSGKGTCGTCKIQILKGQAGPLTVPEQQKLSQRERAAGYRLACQTKIRDDLLVSLPAIHDGSDRKKEMQMLPGGFRVKPGTVKHYIEVPKAVIETQVNDLDRIRNAVDIPELCVHSSAVGQIQQAVTGSRGRMTITISEDCIVAAEVGDHSDQCYGLAFDIGTTTVVGILWDLNAGKMLGTEARTNPQSLFGADVISRIQYCIEEENGTENLHRLIIDCLNEMIDVLIDRCNIYRHDIYEVTAVGNTTMSHIFWNVNPKSMARIPFAPVFCEGLKGKARDFAIGINPLGSIHLLPNIAGHVGSDITGVMIATDLFSLKGCTIVIDIGTNGEILAASEGRVKACSTAAGPAFEGACIHCGMRAATGAIEGLHIDTDVSLQVIGGGAPLGICGSGLIDAIAELLAAGLITKNGNLLEAETAARIGVSEKICRRLRGEGNGTFFVLAERKDADDIVITQQDIREVQLAKGAILGGMMTLMKKLGLGEADIDRLLIAGAFGSYIKKKSAIRMGLLPNIKEEKVQSIGNGAGIGASMALLSVETKRRAELQAREIEHVELAKDADFQDFYIDSMLFQNGI